MKEVYIEVSKSMRRKVGFVVVFTDITRREVLPEKNSIHTAKMSAIKVALKDIRKRWYYILSLGALCSLLNATKKKSPNIKSEI